MPESSMEILLSRVLSEERREATEEERRAEGFCVVILLDTISKNKGIVEVLK